MTTHQYWTECVATDATGRRSAERVRMARVAAGLFGLAGRRLEELDHVAGWILEQDLLPAGPGHDVVAECGAGVAQACDLSVDVVDDEMDSIPAAGAGLAAVRHRAPGRALWSGEEQSKVPAAYVGERRRRARQDVEPEMLGVEGDRFVDVIDHVTDVHRVVSHGQQTSSVAVG